MSRAAGVDDIDLLLIDGDNLLHDVRGSRDEGGVAWLLPRLSGWRPSHLRIVVGLDGHAAPGEATADPAGGVPVDPSTAVDGATDVAPATEPSDAAAGDPDAPTGGAGTEDELDPELRELAIQATILERNQEGLDLWKRLLVIANEDVGLANPTVLLLVPSIYLMLAQFPDFDNYDLSSVRSWASGGSALPPAVNGFLQRRLVRASV